MTLHARARTGARRGDARAHRARKGHERTRELTLLQHRRGAYGTRVHTHLAPQASTALWTKISIPSWWRSE